MAETIITNIKQLVNVREKNILLRGEMLSQLPIIKDAFLIIENGLIKDYGRMSDVRSQRLEDSDRSSLDTGLQTTTINANNATVLPTWCDSHTHLLFAASREEEFIDKIKGLSYADIAAKGGGILNSAKKIREISEEELYEKSFQRLVELIQLGTGAIEIKSGYGLSVEGELKMLRVIKKLKENSPIPIKATFLGAHSFPTEFKNDHEEYMRLIIDEMLPIIADENLADFIDVFCEKGFFNVDETIRICEAGKRYGLKTKLHVNQLNSIGGIEAGIKLNALSLDHLEVINKDEIEMLAGSNSIATLLPTAAYFLRLPFSPARKLIDAGAAIALASDFNPGTSPSGNMNVVVSMSCIQMKMLPEEAINAATINGAFAMEVEDEVGSIMIGKKANLIFTKPIPSIAYLPYAFGNNLIDKVMIEGRIIKN